VPRWRKSLPRQLPEPDRFSLVRSSVPFSASAGEPELEQPANWLAPSRGVGDDAGQEDQQERQQNERTGKTVTRATC